jgi:peptide/nickel transport system permease protein
MAIRNRDFISAARETGEKTWRIIGYEIVPNEVSLIAASFVNTVLYAIGASVALAFIGVTNLNSWSLGTMLYWAQSQQALQLGAWWWFVPPRLRDAASASRIAGRWLPPADPTPVLGDVSQRRGKLAGFLHSFSRSSLIDETKGGDTR